MRQSMPTFSGNPAQIITRVPVVTELPTCPTARLIGPAPVSARGIASTPLAMTPARFACTYLRCWKVRNRYALRIAVTPSMRMVRVKTRTTGVASGTPENCANAGAANQKPKYTTALNVAARVAAVGAMSSSRPRHCTVAGIRPTSLMWMTNWVAASATA